MIIFSALIKKIFRYADIIVEVITEKTWTVLATGINAKKIGGRRRDVGVQEV